MPDEPPGAEVTLCLEQMAAGDASAADRLMEHIYDDLHQIARKVSENQWADRTLQPTALVHEAYLRLVSAECQTYEGKQHFLRVAALAMRQLLTDEARRRNARKRGRGMDRHEVHDQVLLDEGLGFDVVALHETLSELGRLHERQCRVVELRFLAGLSVDETAEALGVSPRTVAVDWGLAKRFLAARLGGTAET